MHSLHFCFFFFFNDTATTEIYTLSLHDALPIYREAPEPRRRWDYRQGLRAGAQDRGIGAVASERRRPRGDAEQRSEEHTSELQSRLHLVCRLLLEKKKQHINPIHHVPK